MRLGRSLCWDGPGPSGMRTRTEMTQTRLMGMEVHRTGRLDHGLLHPWTWLCFGLKLEEKMNAISLPWWWWITLPPSYSGHRCCYVVAEYVFCSHFASGILYVYSSKFLFISDLLRLTICGVNVIDCLLVFNLQQSCTGFYSLTMLSSCYLSNKVAARGVCCCIACYQWTLSDVCGGMHVLLLDRVHA